MSFFFFLLLYFVTLLWHGFIILMLFIFFYFSFYIWMFLVVLFWSTIQRWRWAYNSACARWTSSSSVSVRTHPRRVYFESCALSHHRLVRDRMLRRRLPEGSRGEQTVVRVAGVFDNPPGFPCAPPGVDILEEGKLTSNNVAGSSNDPLQSPAVASGADSKPGGDTAGQDALHSAGVEGSEDSGARSKLPQPSQEEETLMCLLQHCICVSRPCEILGDVNAEELKAVVKSFHLKLEVKIFWLLKQPRGLLMKRGNCSWIEWISHRHANPSQQTHAVQLCDWLVL